MCEGSVCKGRGEILSVGGTEDVNRGKEGLRRFRCVRFRFGRHICIEYKGFYLFLNVKILISFSFSGFGVGSFKISDILPRIPVKATVEVVFEFPHRLITFFLRVACGPAVFLAAYETSFPSLVASIPTSLIIIGAVVLPMVSAVCEHSIWCVKA